MTKSPVQDVCYKILCDTSVKPLCHMLLGNAGFLLYSFLPVESPSPREWTMSHPSLQPNYDHTSGMFPAAATCEGLIRPFNGLIRTYEPLKGLINI